MIRRLVPAFCVLALGLLVSGCAVVELTAHAVKEVEKSQRDGQSRASSSSPASENASPREEEPPPVAAPAPRRSTVTVEELPAR